MPDIDMDFEDARRDEIIQYVTEKYGTDHVAQIITFGTLGAKAAIKDCGRVQGYTPQETEKLTKTIPTLPGWSLDRAYKEITDFRQIVDSDPRMKNLFITAKSVEGIARNAGVHAAGVVISRDPLVDYVPLFRGNDGQAVTAYEMGILEKIGLLKMDFLGLSNLTVLARCVENIKRQQDIDIDVRHLPEGDKKTYEMLGRGETIGVFQLEGGGMTRWVQQLKPSNIRELSAMIALYRPGPMEHIPRFIDTKFGKIKPEYIDDRMKPILGETFGVIVYQDQVLKLVQAIAGFSLGKADILRRAMGKKDAKAMAGMKVEFMDGSAVAGISSENAEKIWELLLPFAGYAFNKAHAVCYGILSYQTGYLKANFPVEYMAALLSVYLDKEDRVTASIEECRRQKIPILQPDVNRSVRDFSIEEAPHVKGKAAKAHSGSAIRFGLVAIKGVGEGIVETIIKEREENGPFTHLYELCDRLKPAGLNRTSAEALIRAGAMDSIDPNRKKLLTYLEPALQYADAQNRSRLAGQDSLFGEDSGAGPTSFPPLPDVPMASRSENLAMEKEVMGIYVSDHPLRGHERVLQQSSTHSCASILEADENAFVKVAGVVTKIKQIITKGEGKRMATLSIEDFSGISNFIAFPATYEKLKDQLQKDSVVTATGFVMHREMRGEKSIEVRLEDIRPLETSLFADQIQAGGAAGIVTISIWRATEGQMFKLREVIEEHPGDYEVLVQICDGNSSIPFYLPYFVNPTDVFQKAVSRGLSRCQVEIQHNEAA